MYLVMPPREVTPIRCLRTAGTRGRIVLQVAGIGS